MIKELILNGRHHYVDHISVPTGGGSEETNQDGEETHCHGDEAETAGSTGNDGMTANPGLLPCRQQGICATEK